MGIRVRKQMGYGLTDVQHQDMRISDPRINPNNRFIRDYDHKAMDVVKYIAWLKEERRSAMEGGYLNMDVMIGEMSEESGKRLPSMYDAIAYDGEYGLPNVLVLTPLFMRDWRRYDDAIDYAVETYLHTEGEDPQVNRADVFKYGLFPWSESWMDARTGERIKGKDIHIWALSRWTRRGNPDHDKMRSVLAKSMGFDDLAHAEENIVPFVPEEVRDLAEYGQLFTDPSVCFQLRPMLYTYWS